MSSGEKRYVLGWSTFVLALTCLPYLYAYFSTPPGFHFIGTSSANSADYNTYLAWMKQAQEGHFFFKVQYTTEFHHRIFFHPLFLLLGKISKLTSLHLVTVSHLARLVSGFMLLMTSYVFLSYFVHSPYQRRTAFLLICFSSGAGSYWLVGKMIIQTFQLFSHGACSLSSCFPMAQELVIAETFKILPGREENYPLDLWVPEAITFWCLYGGYLFSISITLLLLIFLFMLKGWEKEQTKYFSLAGCLTLLLGFIHPYDLCIVYPVVFAYAILLWFTEPLKRKILLRGFLVFFVLSSLSPLYSAWSLKMNPVFQKWSQTPRMTPDPINLIIGYGLLLAAGLWGAKNVILKKEKNLYFLLVWVLCAFALVYVPVSFQRRLIEGTHVPLCILAAIALAPWAKADTFRKIRYFVILSSFSNMGVLTVDIKEFSAHRFPYTISSDYLSSFSWLDKHTDPSQIILTSYSMGNFLPGWAGNQVFAGHYDQTINLEKKLEFVKKFFSESATCSWRMQFLKKQKIDLVYYSRQEKELGNSKLELCSFLKVAFQEGNIRIFTFADTDES